MCGIAGIIAANSENYESQLASMLERLKHRGPDGSGVFAFPNCTLGHTRLSIIDLATGAQPMLNRAKSLAVTFNGEIYGYKELRDELASDYAFETASDTEVILAAYQKYGEAMIGKLPGMFAFGLWDEPQQKFFAARDRFGEKPFYYCFGPKGEFIFASEIKALLATGLVEPIIDRDSVTHFLRHLYVAPGKTIYRNIFTLPPAHTLVWQAGQIEVKRYWQLPAINHEISLSEAVEKFKMLLDQAIRKQLIADVPVAAFLSGGLDSSTIVAEASKYASNLNTLAFGFGDSINELPFAKAVADKYGTKHRELSANDYDLAELLTEMQTVYDEPFADSSNIPTYLISKEASKLAKVVLIGDGGDELFGGYTSWYKPLLYMQEKYPLSPVKIAQLLLSDQKNKMREAYYRYRGDQNKKKYANILAAHIAKNTYFTDHDLSGLLRKNIETEKAAGANLDDVLKFDVSEYLPGDILVKGDRASMANGLEVRAPFLDVDFAEFCLSLPYEFKISAQEDKIILREAMREAWPEAIRARKKQGFGSPVSEWLKEPKVAEMKSRVLANKKSRIFEILDFESAQSFAAKDNYQTWILLTFGLWLEQHPEALIGKD
jgi:asparagine synthase (glutamine-hydrolysing)